MWFSKYPVHIFQNKVHLKTFIGNKGNRIALGVIVPYSLAFIACRLGRNLPELKKITSLNDFPRIKIKLIPRIEIKIRPPPISHAPLDYPLRKSDN